MLLFSLLAVIGVALLDPIPQNLNYHRFADQRSFLGIPNALNVMSNLAFLGVGICGIYQLQRGSLQIAVQQRPSCALFFVALILISTCSIWYHIDPSNKSLIWDRLAMSIAFMSLCVFIAAEHVDLRLADKLLWPMIWVGLLSVVWWRVSALIATEDLRPYAIVQFLPMLLLPIIILCFQSPWSHKTHYWLMFGCYVMAKIFEHYDRWIFYQTGLVSGHTVKHLMAAFGSGCFLFMLSRRYKVSESSMLDK
ncbi:MAG: alkaline phytoceramidase [Deltaproteobacteria bacterium]|nr:alkaline phytoceramidase [Deltaproteobacteria bacterium]